MVDAAVELVEHPGRAVGALQQAPCGDDQIVVIECCPPALAARIAFDDVEAEPQQRDREFDQHGRADTLVGGGQPVALGAQDRIDLGHLLESRLSGDLFARLALLGEEDRAVVVEPSRPLLD